MLLSARPSANVRLLLVSARLQQSVNVLRRSESVKLQLSVSAPWPSGSVPWWHYSIRWLSESAWRQSVIMPRQIVNEQRQSVNEPQPSVSRQQQSAIMLRRPCSSKLLEL